MSRRISLTFLAVCVLLLQACGDSASTASTAVDVPALPGSPTLAADLPPLPELDPVSVERGEILYGRHCASCHGVDLAGAPDWRIPRDDGTFLPPPHDESGHTWHHGDALLIEIIAEGSNYPEATMPTFGDELTRDEIVSILDYLKSTWGPEEREWQWEQTLREQAEG